MTLPVRKRNATDTMNANPLIPQTPDPPSAAKVILTLIREDLKSRKFFEGLRDLGLDDAFYQADLVALLMAGLGLEAGNATHYDFCVTLLRKHSQRVVEDHGALLDEAKRVYNTLARYAASHERVGR
jgi:hypothetical protein